MKIDPAEKIYVDMDECWKEAGWLLKCMSWSYHYIYDQTYGGEIV